MASGLYPWYALHTCSRYEKVVRRLLSEKGFETFLPLTIKRSQVSLRRLREAQIPLFPGYIFSRFSPAEDYYRVRATTGVVRIVGTRKGPIPIPDAEIDSLRRVLSHNISASASPSFASGQRVVVISGPLKGVQGEILRRKNASHFIVKVQLIKRMLEVDFDLLNLEVAPR